MESLASKKLRWWWFPQLVLDIHVHVVPGRVGIGGHQPPGRHLAPFKIAPQVSGKRQQRARRSRQRQSTERTSTPAAPLSCVMRASSHRQTTHAATMKGSTTKHTTCVLITVKHTAKHNISLPRYALREPRGCSPAKTASPTEAPECARYPWGRFPRRKTGPEPD